MVRPGGGVFLACKSIKMTTAKEVLSNHKRFIHEVRLIGVT